VLADVVLADVVLADVVLGVVVAADVAVLFEPPQPATIAATATSTIDMALNLMEAPFPLGGVSDRVREILA
jgi:hypothetical protein